MEKSYVYLIRFSDEPLYKIGMSDNPSKRLAELQSSTPKRLEVIDTIELHSREYAKKIEGQLHQAYKHRRVQGEWFQFSDDEARSIQAIYRIIETTANEYKSASIQHLKRCMRDSDDRLKSESQKIRTLYSWVSRWDDEGVHAPLSSTLEMVEGIALHILSLTFALKEERTASSPNAFSRLRFDTWRTNIHTPAVDEVLSLCQRNTRTGTHEKHNGDDIMDTERRVG